MERPSFGFYSQNAGARRNALKAPFNLQDIVDARSAYQAAQGPVDLDLLRTVTRRFGRDAADQLEHFLSARH